MSILIKGASSLKEGLYQIQDGKIHLYKGNGGRVQEFDLVEVPTPHGHLVDIDEVYRVLTEYYHHSTETQHTALREALSRVPTIIEAEEE